MQPQPQRILVVEDDEAMAGGIGDVLELAGYQVETAHNGREALNVLAGWLPDLIVSDIMMPEMDGYDLFKAVRARPEWLSMPRACSACRRTPIPAAS